MCVNVFLSVAPYWQQLFCIKQVVWTHFYTFFLQLWPNESNVAGNDWHSFQPARCRDWHTRDLKCCICALTLFNVIVLSERCYHRSSSSFISSPVELAANDVADLLWQITAQIHRRISSSVIQHKQMWYVLNQELNWSQSKHYSHTKPRRIRTGSSINPLLACSSGVFFFFFFYAVSHQACHPGGGDTNSI